MDFQCGKKVNQILSYLYTITWWIFRGEHPFIVKLDGFPEVGTPIYVLWLDGSWQNTTWDSLNSGWLFYRSGNPSSHTIKGCPPLRTTSLVATVYLPNIFAPEISTRVISAQMFHHGNFLAHAVFGAGHFNTGTFRHGEFLVVFTKNVDVFFGEVSFISQQLYLALVFCQFSEIFVDLLNWNVFLNKSQVSVLTYNFHMIISKIVQCGTNGRKEG